MNTVPREQIELAWERLGSLDKDETNAIVNQFMEEQPALGIYLFAGTESMDEDDAEESPVIDLVLASWLAMTEAAGRQLESVTPETIDRAEEANNKAFEDLGEGSEMDWTEYVQNMARTYNQRALLGFGIEAMMAGYEESPELAPDRLGMEMLWFKTVLDCLDQ